jgi:hypothetical protein
MATSSIKKEYFMIWLLIGEGPNSVEIPALFWTNEQDAIEFCTTLFDEEGVRKASQDQNRIRWVAEGDSLPKKILEQMYNHYYGGCGECYAATLRSIKPGTRIVTWDLD